MNARARNAKALASSIRTVRGRVCPLCDTPAGEACQPKPEGDHLARYLDAYTAGQLTKAYMAAVVGELVLIDACVVITVPAQPQADAPVGTPDLSDGLAEQAQLIQWHVGVWHDLGYPEPLPSPDCHPIPPLGERPAAAIKGGHDAVRDIDDMIRQLHALREQLVSELRQDDELRAARVDAMLAQQKEPGDA